MLPSHPESKSRPVNSELLRLVLICCGWLSVAAGVVGIFLPLVPTVPFLLLAAACFARSSERFHRWLLEHAFLGPPIRDYLVYGGIPRRVRRIALSMVWVSFPASAFFFAQAMWLKIALLIIATGITLYLVRLPTLQPIDKELLNDANKD
jgi:uncharacterized membrane protein YbaN (DUF454 family)